MTRVGDTSVLYALFAADDAHHLAARDEVARPEDIIIPTETLVETIDLIALRKDRKTAVQALDALLDLQHVSVADPIPVAGVLDVYRRGGGRLSLADAFVVQHCRVLGAHPLTFDRTIRTAAK